MDTLEQGVPPPNGQELSSGKRRGTKPNKQKQLRTFSRESQSANSSRRVNRNNNNDNNNNDNNNNNNDSGNSQFSQKLRSRYTSATKNTRSRRTRRVELDSSKDDNSRLASQLSGNLSRNKGKSNSVKIKTFGRNGSNGNLSKAKLSKIKQSTSRTTAVTCSNEDGCYHKKSPLIFCDACNRSFHLYCKSITMDRYNKWKDDEIYWYCDYCVNIYKSIIKSIDESKNEDNEDQDSN